jgi:hypothetical protein
MVMGVLTAQPAAMFAESLVQIMRPADLESPGMGKKDDQQPFDMLRVCDADKMACHERRPQSRS